MKRFAQKTTGLHARLPNDLHGRLMHRAGLETLDTGTMTTPSDITRQALTEYFDRKDKTGKTITATAKETTPKRFTQKATTISVMLPDDLYRRLIRQVGLGMLNTGTKTTPSSITRQALTEYFDRKDKP